MGELGLTVQTGGAFMNGVIISTFTGKQSIKECTPYGIWILPRIDHDVDTIEGKGGQEFH